MIRVTFSVLTHSLSAACLMILSLGAIAAPLDIRIAKGQDQLLNIAVVPPKAAANSTVTEPLDEIIGNNLRRTGYFNPMSSDFMLEKPHDPQLVNWQKWALQDMDYLVVGKTSQDEQKRVTYQFSLLEISTKKVLFTKAYRTSENKVRRLAHMATNAVYKAITGIPGSFDSRLAYVRKQTGKERYDLVVADSDGVGAKVVYSHNEPILSPAWSPDNRKLAFVTYKNDRSAILLLNVTNGKVDAIPSAPGLNGAPAWSPDGNFLAIVRSYEKNPDIYLYDVQKKRIKAITRHWGIDTEPVWFPDGKSLAFTSSRAGNPHVYRVELDSKNVERLTSEGNYNARPRLIDQGERLVTVHRPESNSNFYLAVTNLKNGRSLVLQQVRLDESPAVSHNGAMLVYATRQERGVNRLMVASINGRVVEPLIAPKGDIREPAWSSSLGR